MFPHVVFAVALFPNALFPGLGTGSGVAPPSSIDPTIPTTFTWTVTVSSVDIDPFETTVEEN